MIEKPNYYAIIPANVRYDSDLTANAKLLYGEITSLCNEKGFCWATNEYFSNLYGVSDRTIRSLIKQLQDKKYIKVDLIDNSKRMIYLDFTTQEKNFLPPRKIISTREEENFLHNNKKNIKNEYTERKNIEFFEYNWLEDTKNEVE